MSLYDRIVLSEAALSTSAKPGQYMVHPSSNKKRLRLIGPFENMYHVQYFNHVYFSGKALSDSMTLSVRLNGRDHIQSVLDDGVQEVLGIDGYDNPSLAITVELPTAVSPGSKGVKPKKAAFKMFTEMWAEAPAKYKDRR